MTLLLSLALLAPLALAPASPQGEESVLATYDLRTVMPRWDAGTKWSQSLLAPPAASPRQELETLDGSLTYADLTSFELLDLLRQILGDELLREGRELMVEDNVLTVLAPLALHEQVRSILEALEAAMAGTAPVRVDVLTLPEAGGELPPAAPVSEEEAARLVASLIQRGAKHTSYVLELSAGRSARLDAYRRIPFLFDYDIEIAQNIMVYEPVMSETREGTRLVLRGLAVPGGLSLSCLLFRSDLIGAIGSKTLALKGVLNNTEKGSLHYADGPQHLQVPQVFQRGLAFDTFLPDGKALVLGVEAQLGTVKTREVVVLRRQGGAMTSYAVRPIPRTNRTLIALDAELFRAPRLTADASPWWDDQNIAQPSLVARFDGEISGFLLEWMKARFSVWRRFGPWILIVTDPAWDRDGAAQLDKLVKSLRPNTALTSVSLDLRAQGREAQFPVRLRVPILSGSTAGFAVVRGETALTDFGAEVAQGAAGTDPYMSSVCEGLALSFSIQGNTCETNGMAQLLDGPATVEDPGYALLGPIERPEPRVLRFDERLELPEGRPGPVRIGGGSDRADQPGLTLEIGVLPVR